MDSKFVWIGLLSAMLARGSPAQPVDTSALRWERVQLGSVAARYAFPLYASRSMAADMINIRQVIVVLHGLQRNGNDYYLAAEKLLQGSGANIGETLLIAPNFFATPDVGKYDLSGMPVWSIQGWMGGEDSVNPPFAVSSIQVLDDLLSQMLDASRFPALERIAIVGHSGGAQIAQRYAVLNNIDERMRAAGIHVRYVIANPSSYLYFTDERPDWKGSEAFTTYNTTWCPNYNDYRYGLDHMIRYARGATAPELFKRYAARDVIYFLGSNDIDPRHPVLDKTCGAEAEGANRNQRGRNYIRYEQYLAGSTLALKRHAYEVVGVGHDQEGMLGSRCAAEIIFGMPPEKNVSGKPCRSLLAGSNK